MEASVLPITYLVGDATRPAIKEGTRLIAHICNDLGGWGRGFVVALSRRWQNPEQAYRHWKSDNPDTFRLGNVAFVATETPGIHVANMIAQHGTSAENGVPPIRYASLRQCLESVSLWAKLHDATVHMPRIGCGLAGGVWDEVEPIVVDTLANKSVAVYVYDLPAHG